jgi:pyruvate/2-oxoglutarate dehydrogenase complex dihydrolipoamide dehydrogenase (E3) component
MHVMMAVSQRRGEMISGLAIPNNRSLEKLAETLHCYPTLAEAFQRIALKDARTRTTVATTIM